MGTSIAPTALLTAEEFAVLPEPREGGTMDLVLGRVRIAAPGGAWRGDRRGVIASALMRFANSRGTWETNLGPGFVLTRNPDTVLCPDVCVVPTRQLPAGEWPEGCIYGPPMLAVGVVGSNESSAKAVGKVGLFLCFGAARAWVVMQAMATVLVFFPGGEVERLGVRGVLTSRHAGFEVEGFELPVAEIFE